MSQTSCWWEKKEPTLARADVIGFPPATIRGTVYFNKPEKGSGLHITGTIEGLLSGHSYALHIHKVGSCASPESSGPEFDPGGSGRHGEPGESPGLHQAGDLPNIKAGKGGKANLDITEPCLDAASSPFSVLGRSIVLYSGPDDYTSQPDGNPGTPIACGVIQSAK